MSGCEKVKRKAEELRKDLILDSMLEHLVYQDKEMRVVWVNRTTLRSTRLPLEELVGRHCYEIWHQRDEPCEGCPVFKALRTGRPQKGEVHHPDGQVLLVRGCPVHDENGELVGVIEVAIDITAYKRAEERIRSLASELALTEEKERRRIAAELHDHIGQTLAVIRIKLNALRESSSPEMRRSLDEIRELLDDVIQSTRTLTFELSPPVLYELGFEAGIEWFAGQLQERHGISIEVEGDGKEKPMDERMLIILFKAVRELCMNVIKHARAERMKISIRRENDEIRIEVEDDGIGFNPKEVEHIGFGLFNVRERLNYINGRMEINSKQGRGTKVILIAPLKGGGGAEDKGSAGRRP